MRRFAISAALAGSVLLCAPAARAASAGCEALVQAGANATSAQIQAEDATIRQPASVRDLTCLGDFFGTGLNLLVNMTDFSALVGNLAGQFCSAVRSAWTSAMGSATCGLTLTGYNLGLGSLGGGSFCPRLTIGGGGAALGSVGLGSGGGGTYVTPLISKPRGY